MIESDFIDVTTFMDTQRRYIVGLPRGEAYVPQLHRPPRPPPTPRPARCAYCATLRRDAYARCASCGAPA